MADLSLSNRTLDALARSPQMRRVLVSIAEDGQRHGESIAPVDEGEYRDSFAVVADGSGV